MNATSYGVIERSVARRMRWNKELDEVEFEAIRDAVSESLETVWRFRWWPEVVTTARRRFAQAYDPAATYTIASKVYHVGSDDYYQATVDSPAAPPAALVGDAWEINDAEWAFWRTTYSADWYDATKAYDPGDQVQYRDDALFYQCVAAGTGNAPTTVTYWAALELMVPEVPYLEFGFDTIGDLEGAYETDPRVNIGARRLKSRMGALGVQFFDASVTQPWLRFLTPPHKFQGEAWDATASYAPDDTEQIMAFTDTSGTGYAGVAQLRARTDHTANQMAYLFYVTAEGDGASGWFRYIATSLEPDDGVDRIRPTDNPYPAQGCWHRVS